ncbi:transposase [Morganella morganii]|nr:transposase [Morganella morganii]
MNKSPQDEFWYEAQRWLWRQRKHAPANADIWHLRFHWQTENDRMWELVQAKEYQLRPMRVYRRADGQGIAQWGAADALVLKWCALHIDNKLPVHARCEHRKGNGGCVRSVQRVREAVESGAYRFVFRTDIRGYYRNIRKPQLWKLITQHVTDARLLHLIQQYLWYGGEFHTPEKGIPKGCSLSPLMGASLLYDIDSSFSNVDGIYYARYMDDFLLLTGTRWQLRRCVAQLNESLDVSGFEQHPGKTYIGKTAKGFDWLGAWVERGNHGISPRSIRLHRERCLRLYEQACRYGLTHDESMARVQEYRKRWIMHAQLLLQAVKK